MATDLTTECAQGYEARGAPLAPYYHSSDSWLAWMAGHALAAKGASAPAKARKGRGYSVRIVTRGETEFTFKARGAALDTFTLTRD